ncbi:MAG: hypothetical protein JW902_03605 [Syntrophaceae bacterium]|nr:hypothetical protein [Syntrophaceae bacterium]
MIPEASRFFKWGTQSRRLYDRLVCGPVTRSEISRMKIHQVDKHLATIKERIAGTGVTVKVRQICEGRRRSREFRLGVETIEVKTFINGAQ